MSYGILPLATPDIMRKQAFIRAGWNLARGALKAKPGSVGAMGAGEAVKKGLGKTINVGLPVGLAGYLGHKALIADPVSQQHMNQAKIQGNLAVHNQIGKKLAEGGILQSMFLGANPSMAYQRISKATGAPMPTTAYPAGQQVAQHASISPTPTSEMIYGQATRNI